MNVRHWIYDPAKVKPQQMVDAINHAGYRASLPAAGHGT